MMEPQQGMDIFWNVIVPFAAISFALFLVQEARIEYRCWKATRPFAAKLRRFGFPDRVQRLILRERRDRIREEIENA